MRETPTSDAGTVRRRTVLVGLAGLGVGAGAGSGLTVGAAARSSGSRAPAEQPGPRAVDPHGAHQAGVTRPGTPQPHCLLAVLDVDGGTGRITAERVVEVCDQLGVAIDALYDDAEVLPDGPGDLTVTVGLGPRLVAAVDPALPGARPLPEFAGDEGIPARAAGGDLLLQLCGSNPVDLEPVLARLVDTARGLTPRWTQRGFRGPGEGFRVRNPLGFQDGITVPTTAAEQEENVWITEGPLAGGSICVVRRLRIDVAGFRATTTAEQERMVGRRRDGTPLSGGVPGDDVNLLAKAPDGEFLVPARSHARAAHPSFTGSRLMLRRVYAYDDGMASEGASAVTDSGLLFVAFQADLRTFVATQQRLDEVDDLMRFVTPTASGTFLILPGTAADEQLGDPLRQW